MKKIIVLLSIVCSGYACAQENMYVQNPAKFDDHGAVRDSVKAECNLESYLGQRTFQSVSSIKENVISASDKTPPADASVLNLSILAVHGSGGAGAYTGAKSMTVRADYQMNGQIVATKTLTVGSRGGFFGGFKGICSILERDADAIARQIANWLRQLPAHQILAQAQVISPNTAPVDSSKKETIYLISPVEYLDNNNVRQSVKEECALPTLTESYILDQANKVHYPIQSLSPYKRIGVAMRVSILDAVGRGGPGDKFLKMHVELIKDGDVIGTKDFESQTSTGLTAGSCHIFEKLVRSFAKQSVQWVIGQISPGSVAEPIEKKE